jgi:hypothetical protein
MIWPALFNCDAMLGLGRRSDGLDLARQEPSFSMTHMQQEIIASTIDIAQD